MTEGPGKYDDLCAEVRAKAEALGVVLVVVLGKCGNGVSVQLPKSMLETLPEFLETLARDIRHERNTEQITKDE